MYSFKNKARRYNQEEESERVIWITNPKLSSDYFQ
jgi:hypothetical protein